jgi:hypothetical protein
MFDLKPEDISKEALITLLKKLGIKSADLVSVHFDISTVVSSHTKQCWST